MTDKQACTLNSYLMACTFPNTSISINEVGNISKTVFPFSSGKEIN